MTYRTTIAVPPAAVQPVPTTSSHQVQVKNLRLNKRLMMLIMRAVTESEKRKAQSNKVLTPIQEPVNKTVTPPAQRVLECKYTVASQSCLSIILSLCQLLKPGYEKHLSCFCVQQWMTEIMWNYELASRDYHQGKLFMLVLLSILKFQLNKNKKPSNIWLWN